MNAPPPATPAASTAPVSFTIPPSISQWFPWLAGPIGSAAGILQRSVDQAAHNILSTPGALAAQPIQGAETSATKPPTDWTLPIVVLGGAAVIGVSIYLFEVEK